MKFRLPKRQRRIPGNEVFLAQLCHALDRSIPVLRSAFLVAGVLGTAARVGPPADFLFVTGLLFHFAIRFEHWRMPQRPR
jgi:hypothetical protein